LAFAVQQIYFGFEGRAYPDFKKADRKKQFWVGISRTNEQDTVQSVMTKKVRSLEPSKKVIDALRTMIEHDIGSVLIVENGKVKGIITERDIVRNITLSQSTFQRYLAKPLAQVTKKSVITVGPNLEIWEAFAKMLENKIRRLPIVGKDGKLDGIVTERDLFKWVVQVAYEPNVPEKLKKLL
jgi:CBS domain-containing protein